MSNNYDTCTHALELRTKIDLVRESDPIKIALGSQREDNDIFSTYVHMLLSLKST